jgi:hypothetical protein
MTLAQALAGRGEIGSDVILLGTPRLDGSLPRGVVVTRRGEEPDWSKIAFTSSISSTGFISPLAAAFENGVPLTRPGIEFLSPGCPVCGEAVAFGVLQGVFGAGGMSIDELRRMEDSGAVGRGKLQVLFTGPALPEILLVSDPAAEEWKSKGFSRRLPRITGRLSGSQAREMARLGMALFRPPGDGELESAGGVPDEVWDAAGNHSP